jgi:antitoxin component of MazEF toxin-antitoxin module
VIKVELMKKESKFGIWGTNKGLRLPKAIEELLNFKTDEIEMTVNLNEDGSRSLLVTEKPQVPEIEDNYTEEEMKYIRILTEAAYEDIDAGRVYNLDDAMKYLAGEL